MTGRAAAVTVPVMDWGTLSSWIAAAISLTSLGGVIVRAWWNRSMVDWEFAGEVRPAQGGLRFAGTVSNFGDGPAHRVVVYVHRPGADRAERIGFAAFVEPGTGVEWSTVLTLDDLDDGATLSVGWTPPPIRRRSEVETPRWPMVTESAWSPDAEIARAAMGNRRRYVAEHGAEHRETWTPGSEFDDNTVDRGE